MRPGAAAEMRAALPALCGVYDLFRRVTGLRIVEAEAVLGRSLDDPRWHRYCNALATRRSIDTDATNGKDLRDANVSPTIFRAGGDCLADYERRAQRACS